MTLLAAFFWFAGTGSNLAACTVSMVRWRDDLPLGVLEICSRQTWGGIRPQLLAALRFAGFC